MSTTDTIVLCVSDVVLDPAWNCRSSAKGGTAELDEAFVESIRERGLVVPPMVRPLDDDQWGIVHGNRRIAACRLIDADMEVLCVVQSSRGDEDEDELEADVINLSENLHRKGIKPHELADKLHAIRARHPAMNGAELSKLAGLSDGYVAHLLRIRERASEPLWRVFCRYGRRYPSGITLADVAAIVRFPEHEQIERWTALVTERTAATKKKPKRTAKRQARGKNAARWLSQVHELDASEEFRAGVTYGLRLALGRERWPEEVTT